MSEAIAFISICPRCRREQLQTGFTRVELERLFNGGHPIEAHCVPCQEFWPISLEKRIELGEIVAATRNVPRAVGDGHC